MDNLTLPAYPVNLQGKEQFDVIAWHDGFTKLELASLMIAQGLATDPNNTLTDVLAKLSVAFAKAVLEEANK